MSMFPFHAVFPRLALRETRNLTFPKGRPGLPADSYALVELYCVEPGCDCRGVMLNVLSAQSGEHVATINFGFGRDDEAREPFLDPLNVQSRLSPALLVQVRKHLMEDPAYVARLERHYRMVKDALADPTHEIHELVSRGLTRRRSSTRPRRRSPGSPIGSDGTIPALVVADVSSSGAASRLRHREEARRDRAP